MRFDVVVVGAGPAGLVTALLLANQGRRVALMERRAYLGGCAMAYRYRGALWTKPHLVTTYSVVNKPGLVGAVRPDSQVREIEGRWLTGDTTRSRGMGIDKAARAGITTAEAFSVRGSPTSATR